jgi:hypothetical protein
VIAATAILLDVAADAITKWTYDLGKMCELLSLNVFILR